jgi:ABC-type glycerol-3-phosphate transport system substrate-binding protein
MIPKNPKNPDLAKDFIRFLMSKERQTALAEAQILVPVRTDVAPEAIDKLGPHVAAMWKLLPKVGTSTGWDDPVPADMAERSFVLMQEMLTGNRKPETIGQELEKLAEAHRAKK